MAIFIWGRWIPLTHFTGLKLRFPHAPVPHAPIPSGKPATQLVR